MHEEKSAPARTSDLGLSAAARISLVATPRSGNTWLRMMLARYLDLREVAVHRPEDIGAIDDRMILQLHWPREASFEAFLVRHRFTPLVIARHPLDVLLSVLHFARREPDVTRWIDGAGGISEDLRGATPCSAPFHRFAVGPGAAALLDVSSAWWSAPGVTRVRYEELLLRTRSTLEQASVALGIAPAADVERAMHAARFEVLHTTANRHAWRGLAGHWQSLLPADLAHEIFAAHERIFTTLGYDIEDATATRAEATRRWLDVVN